MNPNDAMNMKAHISSVKLDNSEHTKEIVSLGVEF